MMYLFVALGCPHCTPPSAVSPYSGQWPSTFGLSHVAVSSQHGWDKEFVSIFAKAKIISLITCTANTDCPCFHGKGKESHQFRQNLSMPHPAWWYGVAFHPIDAMQTYLISPCLLSIQYWFPPWLWQGQRPTGLCRSSLFPGLLDNSVKLPRFLLESQTRNAVRLSEFLLDFHGSPVNALVAPFISCFSTGNCLARYKQFRIDLQCSFVTPRTFSSNLISAVVTSSRNHWKLLHWSWLRSFFLELTSPKSPRSCPIRS